MRILEVLDKKSAPSAQLQKIQAELGDMVTSTSPYPISAFSAMKIAREIDKGGYDVVRVHRIKDAMAAVSARKITKAAQFRIEIEIAPNTEIPKGIPAEIRKGVDLWIFPSQRIRDAYPSDLRTVKIEAPIDGNLNFAMKVPKAELKNFLWIGAIDGNMQRLIAALDWIEKKGGVCTLTICGTAKAQRVMPAVQHSRAITCPQCIIWKGEDFNITDEVNACDAILQAGLDPDPVEKAAELSGTPLLANY